MGEISTRLDVDPTKVKEAVAKFNVATEFDPFHFSFPFNRSRVGGGGAVGAQ